MKAILEFNLPDDRDEFTIANNAMNFYQTCRNLDEWLRGEIKYKKRNELQEARDKLLEIMEYRNINLDMIE